MALIPMNSVGGYSTGLTMTTVIDPTGNITGVGATFTGTINTPVLSATTLSGGTFFSGSTPLSTIIQSFGGTSANFIAFTTTGAVVNTGLTQLTGTLGTNNGPVTGFGNVNGVMHIGDGASAQCAADLLIAYNQLNTTTANFFPSNLICTFVSIL